MPIGGGSGYRVPSVKDDGRNIILFDMYKTYFYAV